VVYVIRNRSVEQGGTRTKHGGGLFSLYFIEREEKISVLYVCVVKPLPMHTYADSIFSLIYQPFTCATRRF